MGNEFCICTWDTKCIKRSTEFSEDFFLSTRVKLQNVWGSSQARNALQSLFTVQCNVQDNGDTREGDGRRNRRELESGFLDDEDTDSDSDEDVHRFVEAWG